MGEPEIVRMLGEAALGEIDRQQQLAAALGLPDGVEPVRRRPAASIRGRFA